MSKHAETIFAAVESADATSSLISSWRRSALVHRLHPDSPAKPERDTEALREALERDALLLALANPYLDELHGALVGSGVIVVLTDRAGLVLAQRDERSYDLFRRDVTEVIGTRYAEQDVGAGSVGTVLIEERPMTFDPGHSYLHKYSPFVGMGAPIFGSDGSLEGVLSCALAPPTNAAQASRDKLLFMAITSFARRIGSELFAATFPKSRLLHVASDGSAPNALIAVASDDSVIGATRSARRLLNLTDARLAGPLSVRDLLGLPELQGLAAAEAKLIEQTMIRYASNRSMVARALGISRSTLYRKLEDLRNGGSDVRTGETRQRWLRPKRVSRV